MATHKLYALAALLGVVLLCFVLKAYLVKKEIQAFRENNREDSWE